MNYNNKKSFKGFTVAELITAVALLGLVLVISASIILVASKSLDMVEKEFDLQRKMRYTSEYLIDNMRYATAVFMLPEESFKESKLTKQWNYIGLEELPDGNNQVVSFTYDPTASGANSTGHVRAILLDPNPELKYKLFLDNKPNPSGGDEKLVYFNIGADSTTGGHEEKILFTSEIEGLNSMQIVDWSSTSNPCTAIAFRFEDIKASEESGPVYISLVLDFSRSMTSSVVPGVPGFNRVDLLKKAVTKLVEDLSIYEKVNINLVMFSSHAYEMSLRNGLPDLYGMNAKKFYNVSEKKDWILSIISELTVHKTKFATNIGDGLRMSYHNFENQNNKKNVKEYMIMFSDGYSNFIPAYTTKKGEVYTYKHEYGDVKTFSGVDFGVADVDSHLDPRINAAFTYETHGPEAILYAKTILGDILKTRNDNPSKPFIKVFFVGFGEAGSTVGKTYVETYAGQNASQAFYAEDEEKLLQAFNLIGKSIIEDMWFAEGPEF